MAPPLGAGPRSAASETGSQPSLKPGLFPTVIPRLSSYMQQTEGKLYGEEAGKRRPPAGSCRKCHCGGAQPEELHQPVDSVLCRNELWAETVPCPLTCRERRTEATPPACQSFPFTPLATKKHSQVSSNLSLDVPSTRWAEPFPHCGAALTT